MEIATLNVIFPGSVGLAQAHPLTKPLAMGDGLPPDLVQLRSTLPIRALVLGNATCRSAFVCLSSFVLHYGLTESRMLAIMIEHSVSCICVSFSHFFWPFLHLAAVSGLIEVCAWCEQCLPGR